MARYIGEYDCKIDAKGRVMLPAALRKQIPEDMRDKLIVNRGLDPCLVMYAVPDWQAETEKLNQLNQFNKVDREFIRLYHNGATEIEVDGASRILIPKKLQDYAAIKGEVVMLGFGNKIEIWAADKYNAMMQVNSDDFSAMAQQLLGNKGGPTNG